MSKISMLKFPYYILLILLIYHNMASVSLAEYCDMIGAGGEIVWIHVPRSQLEFSNANKINYNREIYELDRSERLFSKDGLPSVNEIVVLNMNVASTTLPSCLLINNCDQDALTRWKMIKEMDARPFIVDLKKARINTSAYECTHSGGRRGCWDLNAGARLKILRFTFVGDVLFALARVEKC